MMPNGLFELGICQGAYLEIDCSQESELLGAIQESRAIPKYRGKPFITGDILIVLSQDCDISNPNDKYIEVVMGRVAKSQDAFAITLRVARNPRKLVIDLMGGSFVLEVVYISVVDKGVILELLTTEKSHLKNLENHNSQILVRWRANRYERAPLPDAFNNAFLTGYLNHEGVELRDYFRTNRELIADIFVYIKPYKNGAEDKLLVSFTILMDYNNGSGEIENAKTMLHKHLECIENIYTALSCLQVDSSYEYVVGADELPTLDLAVMPVDFSLEDVYLMDRINLDYVCWD